MYLWTLNLLIGVLASDVVRIPIKRQKGAESLKKAAIAYPKNSTDNEISFVKRSLDVDSPWHANFYSVDLEIGSPGQKVTLVLDSGSSDMIVVASENSPCFGTMQYFCSTYGTFNRSLSTSLQDLNDEYSLSYGDGTKSEGAWVKDTISLAGLTLNMTFGLANKTDSLGVFGIGLQGLEVATKEYSNFPMELKSRGIIKTNSYSIYLQSDKTEGDILFGAIDASLIDPDNFYTYPMVNRYAEYGVPNPIRSEITMQGIGIQAKDGEQITISTTKLPALLDSGSTLSYMPVIILENIVSNLGNKGITLSGNGDGSYAIPCYFSNDRETLIVIDFGGFQIDLPLNQLVETTSTPNKCTFGIKSQDSNTVILGDTFFISAYVVFNLDNYEISLSPINKNATEPKILDIVNTVPIAKLAESYHNSWTTDSSIQLGGDIFTSTSSRISSKKSGSLSSSWFTSSPVTSDLISSTSPTAVKKYSSSILDSKIVPFTSTISSSNYRDSSSSSSKITDTLLVSQTSFSSTSTVTSFTNNFSTSNTDTVSSTYNEFSSNDSYESGSTSLFSTETPSFTSSIRSTQASDSFSLSAAQNSFQITVAAISATRTTSMPNLIRQSAFTSSKTIELDEFSSQNTSVMSNDDDIPNTEAVDNIISKSFNTATTSDISFSSQNSGFRFNEDTISSTESVDAFPYDFSGIATAASNTSFNSKLTKVSVTESVLRSSTSSPIALNSNNESLVHSESKINTTVKTPTTSTTVLSSFYFSSTPTPSPSNFLHLPDTTTVMQQSIVSYATECTDTSIKITVTSSFLQDQLASSLNGSDSFRCSLLHLTISSSEPKTSSCNTNDNAAARATLPVTSSIALPLKSSSSSEKISFSPVLSSARYLNATMLSLSQPNSYTKSETYSLFSMHPEHSISTNFIGFLSSTMTTNPAVPLISSTSSGMVVSTLASVLATIDSETKQSSAQTASNITFTSTENTYIERKISATSISSSSIPSRTLVIETTVLPVDNTVRVTTTVSTKHINDDEYSSYLENPIASPSTAVNDVSSKHIPTVRYTEPATFNEAENSASAGYISDASINRNLSGISISLSSIPYNTLVIETTGFAMGTTVLVTSTDSTIPTRHISDAEYSSNLGNSRASHSTPVNAISTNDISTVAHTSPKTFNETENSASSRLPSTAMISKKSNKSKTSPTGKTSTDLRESFSSKAIKPVSPITNANSVIQVPATSLPDVYNLLSNDGAITVSNSNMDISTPKSNIRPKIESSYSIPRNTNNLASDSKNKENIPTSIENNPIYTTSVILNASLRPMESSSITHNYSARSITTTLSKIKYSNSTLPNTLYLNSTLPPNFNTDFSNSRSITTTLSKLKYLNSTLSTTNMYRNNSNSERTFSISTRPKTMYTSLSTRRANNTNNTNTPIVTTKLPKEGNRNKPFEDVELYTEDEKVAERQILDNFFKFILTWLF